MIHALIHSQLQTHTLAGITLISTQYELPNVYSPASPATGYYTSILYSHSATLPCTSGVIIYSKQLLIKHSTAGCTALRTVGCI